VPSAGRRQFDAVQVPVDVEVAVLHPQWVAQVRSAVGEHRPELGHRSDVPEQIFAEGLEAVSARHGRRVELQDHRDRHGLGGGLQSQEAGVETAESLNGHVDTPGSP
jgi:hypothetical protein